MSNYLFKHPVTPLSNINGSVVNVDSSNWPGRFGSVETSRQFALPDNFSNNANAANASRISNMQGGSNKKHTLRKKIKNIINKYRMPSKKMRKQTKKRLLSLYKRKGCKSSTKMRKTRRKYKGGNAVLNGPLVSSQNLQLVNGTNAYNLNNGPVDGVVNPYNINGGSNGGSNRGSNRGSNKSKKSRHMKKRNKMQKGGYHSFQSDIPMTPSYSTGGVLSAKDLGLANPVPYQRLSNCTNCIDNYNYNTNRGFQFW